MSPASRSKRRHALRNPAMAKTNRLGAALNEAIQAEAQLRPIQYRMRGGWASGSGWRAGRALHARVVETKAPTWSYAKTNNQAGFALVELMLVIGVVAIGTAGVVATYRVVDNNRKVNAEVENAQNIAQNIVTHSMATGDFRTINQTTALNESLFPRDMLNGDGDPRSKWGGDVLLSSESINGIDDWGAVLTFEGVPSSACTKLVSQASPGFYGVRVNNQQLRTNYGAINPAELADACGDGGRVQFVYAKHGGAGNSGSAHLTPCTVPAPKEETIVNSACPTGQLGTVSYRSDYTCYSPYGPATLGAPVEISSTCTPQCVVPNPATETQQETRPGSETLACPPGQTGQIVRSGSERRTRQRTASCPTSPGFTGPVGPVQWSPSSWANTPWSAWNRVGTWEVTSNTCATPCVAPPATTRNYTNPATCPTGQSRPDGSTSFTQTRTGTTTPTCPSPTGPVSPGVEVFTPWLPTAATACAPVCSAPPTVNTPITRDAPNEREVLACPPGQLGSRARERTRRENGISTTTYSCPAPTGNYQTNPATQRWLGTYTVTGSWTETANTCTPACIAPPPSTENGWQSTTCPTGQVTSSGGTVVEQTRSRTTTYKCPAPTGNYTSTTTPWSAWTPGLSTVCAPSCVASLPAPTTQTENLAPDTRTVGCPSFQTGVITQSRSASRSRSVSYSCPAPTGGYTTTYGAWSPTQYGNWSTTSNTCKLPACDGTLVGNAKNYMSRYDDLYAAFGTNYNAAYNHWLTNGSREGRQSCWEPACVAPPTTYTPESRTSPACPAGTVTSTGATTFPQTRVRVTSWSCPSATGPAVSSVSYSPDWNPIRANMCSPACVAPPSYTETVPGTPQTRNAGCPALYTGSHMQSRTVFQTRTVSFSCPSPTGSPVRNNGALSAPQYGAWTTTSNTCALPACDGTVAGNGRNYVARYADLYAAFGTNYNAAYSHWVSNGYREGRISCWGAPCTPPAPQTQWVPVSDNACPAGTQGTRTYQLEQRRDGTCSSPTGSQGYGGWYNTGATRNVNTSQCAPVYASCSGGPVIWRNTPGGTVICSSSIAAGSYAHGTQRGAWIESSTRSGSATFQCNNGVFQVIESTQYCIIVSSPPPLCVPGRPCTVPR